mgnify:CR=1 FL=1
MFLTSSQDLLNIVLALAILWFTVFLCWLLYQAGRVLRNANDIVESIAEKLELITEAIQFIKDKVDSMSSHMGVVGRMASGFVEKYVVQKLSKKLEDRIDGENGKKRSHTNKRG